MSYNFANIVSTGSTTSRSLSSRSADIANVLDYGADPTGVADSTAAINAAGASVINGSSRRVYLPAGTYYVTNAITASCLFGDGMQLTTIKVNQTFSSSALGVITLTNSSVIFPVIRDLAIAFVQPTGQASRSNFLTLASGGTSGVGGTGVKYPPAIYCTTGRPVFENILISSAWDGIKFVANAGAGYLTNIFIGALNVGLIEDGIQDFQHIKGFHFWPFGFNGGTSLQTGVYQDGNTFAAQIGRADGINISDFSTFQGRIQILSTFSWGQFTNLSLDGNNSTFEVAGNQWLQLTNVYATGSSSGGNSNSQLHFNGGNNTVTNFHSNASPSPAVTVTAGSTTVVGSIFSTSSTSASAITQSAGYLIIKDCHFTPNTGAGVWTVPLIVSTGGAFIFSGNSFVPPPGGQSTNVISLVDAAPCFITNNEFQGWPFTSPGVLGFYTTNDQTPAEIIYNSAGTYTYGKIPRQYGHIRIRACGWGGPGGSGAVQINTAASSGGGGGGGAICLDQIFPVSMINVGTGLSVVIGSAPVAGAAVTAAVTSPTAGNPGVAGGTTAVKVNGATILILWPGGAGSGGQLSSNSGGGGSAGLAAAGANGANNSGGAGGTGGGLQGGNGASGTSGTGVIAASGAGGVGSTGASNPALYALDNFNAGGGGSGGGTSAAGAANNGGNGSRSLSLSGGASAGGTSGSVNGTTAVTLANDLAGPGGAGGWGGPTSTAVAGNGGAGSQGDGGGGGGSACAASGTITSGAGGQGGASFVSITFLP